MAEWFDTLRSIINRHEQHVDEHRLARGAAVVLLELSMVFDEQEPAELEVIHKAMEQAFDIDRDELDSLMNEAGRLHDKTVSLHEYTRELRAGLERPARDELVEWLWRVAYADGRIDQYEEHLIRQLAGLLGVPHKEFIRRKHRATEDPPAGQ